MIERYVPHKAGRVGLVKPKQPTRDVAIILESFNDDVHANKQNKIVRKQKQNFQYLVGPVRQLGRGLQLTRACNVILMEPDHKYDHELQAFARVNRIGQKNPITFSYRLLDSGSNIEQDIIVRQMEKNETPGPLVKDARRRIPKHDEAGVIDDNYLYGLVQRDVIENQSQEQLQEELARRDSSALPDDDYFLPGISLNSPMSKHTETTRETTLPSDPLYGEEILPAKYYEAPPTRGFVRGIHSGDEGVFCAASIVSLEAKVETQASPNDDESQEEIFNSSSSATTQNGANGDNSQDIRRTSLSKTLRRKFGTSNLRKS